MRLYAIRASLEDTEVDLTINLEAITETPTRRRGRGTYGIPFRWVFFPP